MIAQSYRNPDVFDEWLEDFTREITQGFGDNFREKLNMDDDDFMEVLRAMLVEMESYDILYTKVSDMDAPDKAAWKETLKLAVEPAIGRLEASTLQILRHNHLGSVESIMFDVGLRLNVTAQGGKRYNLDRRMSRAMNERAPAEPCYNTDEYFRRALRKA